MEFCTGKIVTVTPTEEFTGDFSDFDLPFHLKIIVKSSWNSVILQILTYFIQSDKICEEHMAKPKRNNSAGNPVRFFVLSGRLFANLL